MNMNPWMLERMAEYERGRIRRDMKQIRMEEEAMRAGRTEAKTMKAHLSRLLMQNVCTLVKLWPLRLRTQKTLKLSGSTSPCRG
jgi:hypothetical protein